MNRTYTVFWTGMDESYHEVIFNGTIKKLQGYVTALEEHGAKYITVEDEEGQEVDLYDRFDMKFRVAIMKHEWSDPPYIFEIAEDQETAAFYEKTSDFIKWVTDWIEV